MLSVVCADGLGDVTDNRSSGPGELARIPRRRPEEGGGQEEEEEEEDDDCQLTFDCDSAQSTGCLGNTTEARGSGLVAIRRHVLAEEEEESGSDEPKGERKMGIANCVRHWRVDDSDSDSEGGLSAHNKLLLQGILDWLALRNACSTSVHMTQGEGLVLMKLASFHLVQIPGPLL